MLSIRNKLRFRFGERLGAKQRSTGDGHFVDWHRCWGLPCNSGCGELCALEGGLRRIMRHSKRREVLDDMEEGLGAAEGAGPLAHGRELFTGAAQPLLEDLSNLAGVLFVVPDLTVEDVVDVIGLLLKAMATVEAGNNEVEINA